MTILGRAIPFGSMLDSKFEVREHAVLYAFPVPFSNVINAGCGDGVRSVFLGSTFPCQRFHHLLSNLIQRDAS